MVVVPPDVEEFVLDEGYEVLVLHPFPPLVKPVGMFPKPVDVVELPPLLPVVKPPIFPKPDVEEFPPLPNPVVEEPPPDVMELGEPHPLEELVMLPALPIFPVISARFPIELVKADAIDSQF